MVRYGGKTYCLDGYYVDEDGVETVIEVPSPFYLHVNSRSHKIFGVGLWVRFPFVHVAPVRGGEAELLQQSEPIPETVDQQGSIQRGHVPRVEYYATGS